PSADDGRLVESGTRARLADPLAPFPHQSGLRAEAYSLEGHDLPSSRQACYDASDRFAMIVVEACRILGLIGYKLRFPITASNTRVKQPSGSAKSVAHYQQCTRTLQGVSQLLMPCESTLPHASP